MRALIALGRFFANKTVGAVALVIATIILVLGIIGPWVAPYDKDECVPRRQP